MPHTPLLDAEFFNLIDLPTVVKDISDDILQSINPKQPEQNQNLWVYAGTGTLVEETLLLGEKITRYNDSKELSFTTLLVEGQYIAIELISPQAHKERLEKVWVYAGTGNIIEQNFDWLKIRTVSYDTLHNPIRITLSLDGIVYLEFIPKIDQRKRNIWFFPDLTAVKDIHDWAKVIYTRHDKTGNLNSISLFKDDKIVELFLVNINQQILLPPSHFFWLDKNTNTLYTKPFNLADLQKPVYDPQTNQIVEGQLWVPQSLCFICLKRVNSSELSPENYPSDCVFVFDKTSVIFDRNFNKKDTFNHSYNSSTDTINRFSLPMTYHPKKVSFEDPSKTSFTLELITKIEQQKRQNGLWVFLLTAIPATYSPREETQYVQQFFDEAGCLTKCLFLLNGILVGIEKVTTEIQKERQKRVWVFKETGLVLPRNYNLANAQNITYNDANIPVALDLTIQNQLFPVISLPLVNPKESQAKFPYVENGIWVYANTANVLSATEILQIKYIPLNNNSDTLRALLEKDDLFIPVELLSQPDYKLRSKKVWVYRGTAGHFTDIQLIAQGTSVVKDKFNVPKEITVLFNEKHYKLELLNKDTLKARERFWVYPGTHTIYSDQNINVSKATLSYDTFGNPASAKFLINGKLQQLHSVPRSSLNKPYVWVSEEKTIVKDEDIDWNKVKDRRYLKMKLISIVISEDNQETKLSLAELSSLYPSHSSPTRKRDLEEDTDTSSQPAQKKLVLSNNEDNELSLDSTITQSPLSANSALFFSNFESISTTAYGDQQTILSTQDNRQPPTEDTMPIQLTPSFFKTIEESKEFEEFWNNNLPQ